MKIKLYLLKPLSQGPAGPEHNSPTVAILGLISATASSGIKLCALTREADGVTASLLLVVILEFSE